MIFFKSIRVKLNERVVLFKDSIPVRALGPGRHRLFGSGFTEQRFSLEELVFSALPEVIDMIPDAWFLTVVLSDSERGVICRDGRAVKFLKAGVRHFWTIDPSVELIVFDVEREFPRMTEALESIIPVNQYTRATITPHERGLLKISARLHGVLDPGLYVHWNSVERPVTIDKIDVRRSELAIVGQELMTRDKVTLRLSLSVEYAVENVELSTRVSSVRDAIYVAAQLAARDFVAGVTLDGLLEGRDAFTEALMSKVGPEAQAIGVCVERVGVKDVVLPGEMKSLMNRVIEAEKEAQANVILRREETAATRSLANTAKVMAAEPVLLRLKELEAMKEIAENIAEVRIVVGADNMSSLIPAQFLAQK